MSDNPILAPDQPQNPSIEKLSSVSGLFLQSWDLFKKSLIRLFLVNLSEIAVFTGLLITIYLLIAQAHKQLALSGFFSAILISGLMSIFLLVIIATAMLAIADILIFDASGQIAFKTILKRSMKLIIPYVLVGCINFLLIQGGYFLLIFPGIVFSIFFLFISYEVVLNEKRYLHAFRVSYALIASQFWQIIGRLLPILVFFLFCFSAIASSNLLLGIEQLEKYQLILSVIQFILQILTLWFVNAYSITLYKQLKLSHPASQEKSIRWVGITSGIGWIIGLLLLGYLFYLGLTYYKNNLPYTVTAPSENESICLGQPFTIRMQGPKPLYRMSINLNYPVTSAESNQISGLVTGAETMSETLFGIPTETFRWNGGEIYGGNYVAPGNGYSLVVTGFYNETDNNYTTISTDDFNIVNCSGKKNAVVPEATNTRVEITSPAESEVLCLGQNYTVRWQATKQLYNPQFQIYTTNPNLVYTFPDPQITSNSLQWDVGQTNEGPVLPESPGYSLAIMGYTDPNDKNYIFAQGNSFTIMDCSKHQPDAMIPFATFKNEGGRIMTPIANDTLCMGSQTAIAWDAQGAFRGADLNVLSTDATNTANTIFTDTERSTNLSMYSGTSGTFYWDVGNLENGMKLQPGENYMMQFVTKYDDGNQTSQTGPFSLKECH